MIRDIRGRLERLTSTTVVAEVHEAHDRARRDALDEIDDPDAIRAVLRERLRSIEDRAKRRATAELPGSIIETDEGPVHVVRLSFAPSHRHGTSPVGDALEVAPRTVRRLSLDEALEGFDPAGALFLDTETTGLAGGTGTIPFLIGLGWFEGGTFLVEQLFVREPAHEPATLAWLGRRIERATALVSYNGKAFDWPLLRTRFVMARSGAPPSRPHLDLLAASRRVYKRRVGECRLVSLESHVLGFVREGDVPGSMIPGIYQDWLWSGATAMLEAVFEHNAQDIVALPALLGRLGRAFESPELAHELDRIGLAATAVRDGAPEDAESILATVGARDGRALHANLLRRRGARDEAASVWRAVLAEHPDDPDANLAMAKHAEHVEKDWLAALAHARKAEPAEPPETHARRLARLEKKASSSPLPRGEGSGVRVSGDRPVVRASRRASRSSRGSRASSPGSSGT